MKLYLFLILLAFMTTTVNAQQVKSQTADEAKADTSNPATDLSNFGFGPAFYMINYDKNILKDSKDVRVRGDGTLESNGSGYGTVIGLEVHYDISLFASRTGYLDAKGNTIWNKSQGFILSPFIGVYDIDSGINGLVVGGMLGYWSGDENFENKTSLNIGVGWTVHKDRLVLADGIAEGEIPDDSLQIEDYTTRDDVKGWTVMVSVSTEF